MSVPHTTIPAVSPAPKTTGEGHELPHGRAEGVADEGQGGDDPRAVGEGQVAPRRPALADDERGQHGAGAGGREDRAVASGAGVQVVAHDEGQEDLERADEQQQAQRRRHQRGPQPGLRAHEGHGLAQLAAHRRLGALGGQRAHAQAPDAGGAGGEGPGVDEEGRARADGRHDEAADGRPQQPLAGLAHELLERVGLHQVARGHDLWHERAEGRAEEGLARPVEDGEHHQVPDLEHARQRQHAGGGQHERADQIGRDQHAAALHAVADDPAGEQERGHAAGPRQPDQRERHRVVVDVVDLPGLGHDEDAVAEQRDGHAGPQQREVALTQGPQQLHVAIVAAAMLVAIDGPAGAGKSTVARAVARALGFTYLDSGALYRAVALSGASDPSDLDIRFDGERVLLDGRDVSAAIRTPEISQEASRRAADPTVRTALLDKQRALIASGDWVAEGRDIGTVVAPDAELKVWLTADEDERARRRGVPVAEVRERDERDASREHSPMVAAADAVEVDTTGLGIDDVVARIVALVGARTP
jgi:CMP/dCMP kinase